jgi:hypothetical protein
MIVSITLGNAINYLLLQSPHFSPHNFFEELFVQAKSFRPVVVEWVARFAGYEVTQLGRLP